MANEVWPHGNKETVVKIIKEKNEKKNLCYCNFDINTNQDARSYALQVLKDKTFIDFEKEKLNFEDYLRNSCPFINDHTDIVHFPEVN